MGRGRRKAMAKKMVREVKYFSPKVDVTGLAEEIGTADDSTFASDVHLDAHVDDSLEKCQVDAERTETEKPLHEMNEDELQEYLEWSKNAASKPQSNKLEHIK
jgi:hypothetical protein